MGLVFFSKFKHIQKVEEKDCRKISETTKYFLTSQNHKNKARFKLDKNTRTDNKDAAFRYRKYLLGHQSISLSWFLQFLMIYLV